MNEETKVTPTEEPKAPVIELNRAQRRQAGIQDYAVILYTYKLAEGDTPSSANPLVVRMMGQTEYDAIGKACAKIWQSAAAQPKTAEGKVAISLICGAQTMPWGVFIKKQEEAKREAEFNPQKEDKQQEGEAR